MGGFYSHDDEPTAEQRAKWQAEDLANTQRDMDRLKTWIDENLEKMNEQELRLIYNITEDVSNFRTFFEVLKNLNGTIND